LSTHSILAAPSSSPPRLAAREGGEVEEIWGLDWEGNGGEWRELGTGGVGAGLRRWETRVFAGLLAYLF